MESKIQFKQISYHKNKLVALMAMNQYVLMISLVSLLKYTNCEYAVYKFINNIIKESKYYSALMKKNLTKNL